MGVEVERVLLLGVKLENVLRIVDVITDRLGQGLVVGDARLQPDHLALRGSDQCEVDEFVLVRLSLPHQDGKLVLGAFVGLELQEPLSGNDGILVAGYYLAVFYDEV